MIFYRGGHCVSIQILTPYSISGNLFCFSLIIIRSLDGFSRRNTERKGLLMKKHETAFKKATPGQIREIVAKVVQAVPLDISFELADELISDSTGRIAKAMGNVFSSLTTNSQDQQRFYEDVFGKTADPSIVPRPNHCKGFNWVLYMAEGLTMAQIIEACRTKLGFKVWLYIENLDQNVRDVVARPTGPYCVLLRDRVEADDELKNKSAEWIERKGIDTLTLKERLLLEAWYFWKYHKHLDIENATLCAGSRNVSGYVPYVVWSSANDKLLVRYYNPQAAHDGLRARAAVAAGD